VKSFEHIATIGPCTIDSVPIGNFTKVQITREELESLWRLCGPSAERNMSKNPLWMVIAMAYYEGLSHGVNGVADAL
jgi:hypothetical protein